MDGINQYNKAIKIKTFLVIILAILLSSCVTSSVVEIQKPDKIILCNTTSNTVFSEYCLIASNDYAADKKIAELNAKAELLKTIKVQIKNSIKHEVKSSKKEQQFYSESIHSSNQFLSGIAIDEIKYHYENGIKYLCLKLGYKESNNEK